MQNDQVGTQADPYQSQGNSSSSEIQKHRTALVFSGQKHISPLGPHPVWTSDIFHSVGEGKQAILMGQ